MERPDTVLPSTAAELEVAIVGCGPRGIEHAEAVRDVGGLCVAAVADRNDAARSAAARRFGVPGFASMEALLAAVAPPIVVLATQPSGRAALLAAAADMPTTRAIVAEKPLELDLAEAERMVAACEAKGILLAVSHQSRYAPSFLRLKRAIERGDLGEIELLRGTCYGNLLNQGSHVVDSLRWLAGRRLLWVMSQAEDDPRKLSPHLPSDLAWWRDEDHPAAAWMVHHLAFEGGIRASMETGILHPRSGAPGGDWVDRRVVAVGSRGVATCRIAGGFRMVARGGQEVDEPDDTSRLGDTTRALHAEVRDALAGRAELRSAGRDALASLEALLACMRSAAGGGLVALPLSARTESRAAGIRSAVAPLAVSHRPRVSILMALDDHRDRTRESIESWTRAQRFPSGDIELLVASSGRHPDVEAEARAALRPADRLLSMHGANRAALYDAAARAATGDTLVLTEAHCIADPDCVDELVRFLARGGYVGACAHTLATAENELARFDQVLYEEGFREHRRPDDWRKVIPHGFAIGREAYLEAGGLDPRYDVFADQVLAQRLRRRGLVLGYAEKARVHHCFSSSLADTLATIRSCTTGQARFRELEFDREGLSEHLFPPGWLSAEESDRRTAALLCAAALRRLGGERGEATLGSVFRALGQFLPPAVLGVRGQLALARCLLASASLRCRFWRADARRLERAYRDFFDRAVRHTRFAYVAGRREGTRRLVAPGRYEVGDIPGDCLGGFHPFEVYAGEPFRWSGPVAALHTSLPAARYRLAIETRGLRGDAPRVTARFEGRSVPAETARDGDGVRIAIRADRQWFLDDARQRWVLVCDPLRPWQYGSADRRELGVPLFAIEIERLD